jgi:hypothetical protein
MEREYTDDDIRAATRGLNMYRLTIRELSNLRDEHDKRVFASRVIREAAARMIVVKTVNLRELV